MICNVDRTWTLEKQDIDSLNATVAKLLEERADSKVSTFNTDRFVKYIYDLVLDGTKDVQKALAFARHVPTSMTLTVAIDPQIRIKLQPKGYTTASVEALHDRFANSLQEVVNWMNELAPKSSPTAIAAGINALNNAELIQTEPVNEPGDIVSLENRDAFSNLPYTPLSTTGNEKKEGREWYYDFLKRMGQISLINGISNDGTVSYPGVEDGIRMVMVRGGVPEDQAYPDEQSKENLQASLDKTLHMIITDKEGNTLYFDNDYNVTTKENGRLVYFPIRKVPTSRTVNGTRVFDITEQEGKSIIPVASRVKAGEVESDVISEYQMAYEALQSAIDYINANPGQQVAIDITGFNRGTLDYNGNIKTPIGDIKNLGGFSVATKGQKGRTYKYIVINNVAVNIPLVMNSYDLDTASKVADLILNPVYNSKGDLISNNQKLNVIKPYTRLGREGITIDANGVIRLGGEVLDVNDLATAKKTLMDYLTRDIPTSKKDKDGNIVNIKNQFYFEYDLFKTQNEIHNFTLQLRPDGGFNYSFITVPYRDWVKNNANVPVVLDENGEIKEYNGYVTYRINIDAQRKFSKQTSSFGGSLPSVKKAVEPSVQESTTPDINDIPQSLKDAIASGIISPDKLYSVRKGGTVKQAVAKVTTGKTWFDNTTIKYKDSDGNIVEKKFSEVMPYTALFNVVNSEGRILAEWTKNGITLFHGSTYDELYHEAWHGFTQMFLTPAQRQELYDGVKSLDTDINYYDHTLGEWKKMKAADLDFTNADHILYAEEYLADAFKAYALDKKAVSKKFKNIFQKIWEALKALFSRTSKESITDPLSVGPIKQAFNNLYTGNLVDYTYNQANIQFKKLNNGITATNPTKGGINGMNIADSLLVINMLSTHISDFIDMANDGLFGSKTNAYTINTILDPKVKKVALRYAKEMMQKNLDAVQAKLEETTEDSFKGPLLKKAAVLSAAVTNFGNIENLSDNKDSGVLAFYNKRTNFLNLEAVLEDDEYDNVGEELDPEKKVVKEGKGRDGLSAGSGNEFSGFDRLPTIMLYIFGSVYERTVVDPNLSPDGFLKDKYGTKKTIPANTMYNFLSSLVEGITDPEEMYKKLELYSTRKLKDGSPDPKAQMVKQFLNKLGKPSENNTEMAENLWSYFYNAVRYDRVPGIQVTIEMKDNGQVSTKVGNTDGAQKALNRFMEEAFADPRRNPSNFIIREEGNNLKLDIEGLKKKYPSIKPLFKGDTDKVSAAVIEYLNDWGFTVTPTAEFVDKIIKIGFVEAFHNYVAKKYFELSDQGKAEDIRTLGKLMMDRAGTFNKLLNVEAQVNPKYTDHMIPNSNGDLVSERFNPSGVGTMLHDVNTAPSYQAVVAQPHLAHLNVMRNPAVKASQNFKKMFGENRGNRVVSADAKTPVVLKFQSILGTQVVKIENEISSLISGMSSAASDTETATMRDFFLVNLHGTTEAFRHADKNQAYIVRIEGGDPGNQYYIAPLLFTKLSGDINQGRKQGNKIIMGYLAAEIERIRNVQKEYVVGENANDIIFSGKSGEYKTLKTEGNNFTMFDGILSKDLKEELLNNESLQTYESVMKALQTNVELAIKVENEINAFMSKLIEEDRQAIDAIGFKPSDSIFNTLARPFGNANTTDRYNAAIENYTYSSFIHKVEMQIMVYGELAQYNHGKDEHMKRIAAFFATGKLPRIDRVYNKIVQDKPGRYAQSEWYKNSGLPIPEEGLTEGTVLNTAVLEDPIEDSVYFDTMVDQFMLSKNWDLKDNEKRKIAEAKYKNYRDMKTGDAQGWMTFDAYRALERRLNNWSPYKESLYNDIMAGKTIDIETLQSFFPVKKMQYAGPLGTQNFSVSAFHKYSLMPLIPSMIKGTRLEKLHNKMVSQGIAYTVLHSGSKLASVGKDGKLDLFYKNAKGQNDPAFEGKDYTFSKNPIFLQYLKEQVITQDTAKGKIKFPTQPRKLIVSGLKTFGVPSDFMSDVKDDNARRTAWNKLKTEKSRIAASKNYELETTYVKAIDTVIKVATQKLRMELGYKDPNKRTASDKPNMNKLVEFIKSQFANRQELSEYDLDFIAVGSNGELVFPADLASNPSQIEKLISSLINKRVFDQMTNGEAFIQGSNVGFEKFAKPAEDDLIKYGTGGLRFYVPGPDGRILPMQVKIAMSDKFKYLLELKDLDGKRIGTVDRLNTLIKNEKWLSIGDHRKMITMTGVRIPTQGMNSIEAMEVGEFLPPEAGNIMIVPLEMVAKSGGDFDIDKLVTIIPVIKNNMGSIELSRPVKTRKLLKTIIDEKEKLKDELNGLRKEYIKKDLTPEFRAEIAKEEEEQRAAREAFDQNYVNDFYVGGSLDAFLGRLDAAQKRIDALYEQLKGEKKEVYAGKFDEYIAKADAVYTKMRALNKEQDSYSPEAYQNDLMDSMIDIILRGDNYTNLTLPNDTSVYTGDTIGTLSPVEEFGKVNRTYRPLDKSPTNVLTNKFNTQKAAAIQAGKAGIGMSATGNTFFALFKSVGLTLNHLNKVTKTSRITKKTTKYEIVQKLRLDHNTLQDDNGNTVISVGHTYDADGINDISDTISQLMNGYLDVAKEAWIFDINASKELESELEFMIMAGVPVNNAVGLLSQPLVREYLRLVKQNTSPYDNVRKQSVTSPTFAKYNALKDIFAQIGIIGTDDMVSTETLVTEAINRLNSEGKENFTLKELRANKDKELFSPESIQSFMHFVEVSYMTKGLQQLKRTLNVDTSRNNTVSQVYNAQNKIKSLSNVFDSAGIGKLMTETVLSSFMLHDVFIDSVAAMLPLRASSVINNYIDNIIVNSDMDMDEKEKYQNSFISDLVSYIYANRSGVFNLNDTSYYGIGVNGSADISIQPILKFGAFFNQDSMTLDVDPVSINKDFDTGAFGTQGYGKGQLAVLPKDTFSNYGNKGRTLYRAFVYERELLRAAIPYATINENREFRIFRQMRTKDLGLTGATDNLPMRYEEFIRNKALEAVSVDKALFRTSKADGIYSVADQFMELIANEPGLLKNYEVLNALQLKVDRLSGMRFIAPALKTKDGILITSYVTEMLELMDPAEVKSNDDGMNMFISEFFSKLQKTAFLQAGNNAASGLYMTNYFDQTAIAETMKEPLDKFLEAINDPMKAKAFLDDYRRKLDIKLMSGNKNAYVNYIIGAPLAAEYSLVDDVYAELGSNTQSENVILPEDLEENTIYDAKNFWSKLVPEARSMYDDKVNRKTGETKSLLIAYRGNKNKSFLQNYKDGNAVGNPFDFADETGTRKEQGIKSTKKFIDWMITGNNLGNANATSEYRQAIINDIKSGKIVGSPILYYAEKNYATHATALDYLINKYDWNTQPSTQEPVEIKTISEPYGVLVAETNPSQSKTQEFVSLIQPQIQAQAYQENVTGNKMFMYGLRWTRKSKAIAPLNNKSFANKGLPITDAKAEDNYVYDTVDQNGKPLAAISNLQPIINEIQNSLGIDMSSYDAVIGNIYLPGQRIQIHRDTTESVSARNYPVVVYTIGAGNAINVYENEKYPGKSSFASDKKTTIPTKNGTIYTFGMNGKGRFELGHDTPHAIKKTDTLNPITMPNGDVIKDYTITLTFRRAADLEPGMPSAPAKLTTQPSASVKNFNKKNLFTVTPQQGVSDNKAKAKASIATQYIGFGEGIVGKDGKRSTTQIYREQAGEYANTGNYSASDVIFVSVPGLRGDTQIAKREQDKTIKEAIKAVEAGATILTDNKAYTDSSGYNTGEKRLYANMETKGYNYSEITVDDQVIGTWSKSTRPYTSSTEVEGTTSKFSGLISPMTTLTTVVDYSTGETKDAALVYDQSRFMKGSTYNLSIEDVETIFSENPDSVFIFDNTYATASGVVDATPRSNTQTAWRKGLPTGNSFGINTRTINGVTPTDENYSKAKDILDAQIDELVRMRDLGKKIVFPSMGVGQNLMGLYIDNNGKYARGNTVPAPSLFVYLSKRLLEEFGYTNPTFSLIETKTLYDEGILGGKTGLEFVQGFYKEQGIQTTTDADVLEQIKHCKGLI